MPDSYLRDIETNKPEASYDELMANLFALITHHSLTQCQSALQPIVDCLNALIDQPETEYYPSQRAVFCKMRTLWSTRLFKVQQKNYRH